MPNLTFRHYVIASVRGRVDIPFDAHLMVADSDRMLDRYVAAGCELVIVYAEARAQRHRTLTWIRELGARSGVALSPATPASTVAHVLAETDLVLAMTVNPGSGGQGYLPAVAPKIREVRH